MGAEPRRADRDATRTGDRAERAAHPGELDRCERSRAPPGRGNRRRPPRAQARQRARRLQRARLREAGAGEGPLPFALLPRALPGAEGGHARSPRPQAAARTPPAGTRRSAARRGGDVALPRRRRVEVESAGMQFSCESCKTQLQIADEKIRGRRLLVRCRRCGAKIALADPAVSGSSPRLVSSASPGPVHTPRPRPFVLQRPQTDLESTQAMDSAVLEQALEASRSDEGSRNGAPVPAQSLPSPSTPVAEPVDAPAWFAMLQGKQTGPLTRAELEAQVDGATIGPRTYVWREGMDSWQRAKDVGELHALFPQLPPASRDSAPALVVVTTGTPAPAASRPAPVLEAKVDEGRATATAAKRAATPAPGPQTMVEATPHVPTVPLFESSAPKESRAPFVLFLGLIALVTAAIVVWIVFSVPAHTPDLAAPASA